MKTRSREKFSISRANEQFEIKKADVPRNESLVEILSRIVL